MKFSYFIWLVIFSKGDDGSSGGPSACTNKGLDWTNNKLEVFLKNSYSLVSCKTMPVSFASMVTSLGQKGEALCIEDASIGSSTVTIYLQALMKYFPNQVNVTSSHLTFDGRCLFEVVIESKSTDGSGANRPTIIIDAGQEAGSESVGLALHLIEQLISCIENNEMIEKVRWVIMPSVNPDGQEFSRYEYLRTSTWKKNCRTSNDRISFGVDISRNFDTQWHSCNKVDNVFSQVYPGPAPSSENETLFIKSVIAKHKHNAKAYLSIKRDGHSIGYPHAYTKNTPTNLDLLQKIASEIAFRVNQRSSGVHLFANNSIYEIEGRPHCGHSVDFAYESGIPLAFEMRVFLGSDNRIMSKFQTLPRGYENLLRKGYLSGIRALYTAIINEKKYDKF